MSETGMSDQARASRAEYYRRWRQEHPKKTSEYCRRYWEKRSRNGQQNSEEETPNGGTETGNGD